MSRYSDLVVSDGGANLLDYYPLDAEHGLNDLGVNNHDATAQGDVVVGTVTGPGDLTATDFDGNGDYVSAATTQLGWWLSGATATVEMWVYLKQAVNHTLLSTTSGDGRSRLSVFANGAVDYRPSTTPLDWLSAWPGINQWVHLMLYHKDTATRQADLLINGVSQGVQTPTALGGNDTTLLVGGSTGLALWANARICHVATYSGDQRTLAMPHYIAGRAHQDAPTGSLSLSGSLTDTHAFNDSPDGALALVGHMRESTANYRGDTGATYGGTPGATYGGGTTATYGGGTTSTYALADSASYNEEY